jgi:hypothetical protein
MPAIKCLFIRIEKYVWGQYLDLSASICLLYMLHKTQCINMIIGVT